MKDQLAKTFLLLALFAPGIPRPLLALQFADRPVSVRGEVRFADGGRHAENVLVKLEEFEGGLIGQVRTDRAGRFEFMNLRIKPYRVSARLTGYGDVSREVDLMTNPNEYVILTLVSEKTGGGPYPKVAPGTVLDARVPREAREEYAKGRAALLDDSDTKTGIFSVSDKTHYLKMI